MDSSRDEPLDNNGDFQSIVSHGPAMDSKGFTFVEVNSVRAGAGKLVSCDFSPDGKLLATGGHDKKVVLWYPNTLRDKRVLGEFSMLITDVRFSSSSMHVAASSFDKSIGVWDTDNPGHSVRNFSGSSAPVISLDFHPNKEDLICSCDQGNELSYWSINKASRQKVFKGGNFHVRFQPCFGRYLAAAAEDTVSILDVETQACQFLLKGHSTNIQYVCWDPSGKLLASVSLDSVRVWTFESGSDGECLRELRCKGNKFYSCVFHPSHSSLLVIGCYQSLELWNIAENKSMSVPAHEGIIASLSVSTITGLVASASHDKAVKLWK